MARVRGHAARAVRAGGALPGEADHPGAARRSHSAGRRRFDADGGSGRARRTSGPCGTRWPASRRPPRHRSRTSRSRHDLVGPANGAVGLRLLRVGAGRNPLRTGRLSPRDSGWPAGRRCREVPEPAHHPARRRPSSSPPCRPSPRPCRRRPSPSGVRRAARSRRDHRAIPRLAAGPERPQASPDTSEDHTVTNTNRPSISRLRLLKTAGYSRAREHRGPGHEARG